jgi:hypothetical protein
MSWTEKLKTGLKITTGDGKKFTPLYKLNPKTTDFNVAEFEFPNIEGTLVKRSLVKGTKMSLEFYFQGEDHLSQSLEFEESAKDKRPFIILHPFFGEMTVQPTSLSYDPTGLNLTKVTGNFIETISDEYPRLTKDPKNKIALSSKNTQDSLVESFGSNVIVEPSDINSLNENNASIYALGSEAVQSGNQANEYFQLFQTANSAVSVMAANTSNAAQQITNLYTYPSLFVSGVKERLTLLFKQLVKLGSALNTLSTPNQKKIYELSGGAVLTSIVTATINPLGTDYKTSKDVIESIDSIVLSWNTYINNIEAIQTDTNDLVDSYVPDFNSLSPLMELINFATANLINIALDASSERSIILDSDSNAILLTHRFYGLNEGDSNLNKFINQNNLSANELIEIKKGKKIVYYI